jgi:hypothetical protein
MEPTPSEIRDYVNKAYPVPSLHRKIKMRKKSKIPSTKQLLNEFSVEVAERTSQLQKQLNTITGQAMEADKELNRKIDNSDERNASHLNQLDVKVRYLEAKANQISYIDLIIAVSIALAAIKFLAFYPLH